jgi:mitogen-activated protein kinase kinase kinase
MEYVDGGSLADEIADPMRGRLSVERVVRVSLHVLRGLEFMHAHGFVHRDIKPANILIDKRTNSFKLCDWIGEEEEKVRVEQTGRPVGTPVFLAPEVARSPHRHCGEGKSDIWALGCTVLNLATGRLPWEGTDAHGRTNEFMVMFKTAYGHAPPMATKYDPREPDQPLAHFLRQCLEPAATARPRASALLQLALFKSPPLMVSGACESS